MTDTQDARALSAREELRLLISENMEKAGPLAPSLGDAAALKIRAAYYSVLAIDDQEILLKEQGELTKAMHDHSKCMLRLSKIMVVMTIAIALLTILMLCKQ